MSNSTYAIDSTLGTLLKDLGIAPSDVLRRADLSDDLMQQSSARLSSSDYHRLWARIEEASGEPFPVIFCQALCAESFSPPMFAALCSPNLVVAAERVARYKAIVAPMRLSIVESDVFLSVELHWLDCASEPPHSLVLAELLSFVALARIGTREFVRPVEVRTTHLPDSLAAYEDYIGSPLLTGGTHRISFAIADSKLPFLTSCDGLWNAFEPDLRQRLADLDASVTTTKRVRAVLLEGLPAGLMTMEAVARKLAMSKRTLQRRIVAEGGSYQQVLNETREALARHYLENTVLPTGEISFLLGFDEPNSFYRAFRGWTGKTPDSVRRLHPQPH